MAESKFSTMTAYHSISNDMSDHDSNRPKMELGSHPQIAGKRSWLSTIFWQTFALLWLVPVVALLYLNFSTFIIGASAWCPAGHCWINAFNDVSAVPQERMKKFDKQDHNLLGGLQFVAKALEVWFGIIAAALIYLITMRFAGKKEGLPIGYLTRPMEFADVVALFDPLFWVTGPTPYGIKSQSEKRVGRRVWSLIALSVFLCILINLMGPATAVLVIPSLQWITTSEVGNREFLHMNGARPPQTDYEGWMWWDSPNCDYHQYVNQNYSCTYDPIGLSLDTWVDSALANNFVDSANTGWTLQSGLSFTVNFTEQVSTDNSLEQLKGEAVFSDYIFWAPSRQIISNLSVDQIAVADLSRGETEKQTAKGLTGNGYLPDPIHTYVEYNKSLELLIRRNGPIAGTVINKWYTWNDLYQWTVDVDAQRQIRCYGYYNLGFAVFSELTSIGNYTKCIRIGTGWSDMNRKASFSAPGAYDLANQRQGPGVSVNIYSSDHGVFLPNGTIPSWLPPACLSRGSLSNNTICDWNRLFNYNSASPLSNRTENINTMEMRMQGSNSSVMLVVDFVAYYAFTNYQFDPYFFSNPQGLVQTEELPSTGTSFAVDPSWILAGWSVGHGESLFSNRTITNLLLTVMSGMLEHPFHGVWQDWLDSENKVDYLSFFPVMQTLSLIDHSTTMTSKTSSSDPAHPLLQRNARMYVWAYGMGSRTSYLGAVVAILGCLVVVWQFVLGFVDRRRFRSPTQLLVASLEHCPRGEFEGRGHDEKEMARVKFHIRDDDNRVGKYSFYEPDASDPQ